MQRATATPRTIGARTQKGSTPKQRLDRSKPEGDQPEEKGKSQGRQPKEAAAPGTKGTTGNTIPTRQQDQAKMLEYRKAT